MCLFKKKEMPSFLNAGLSQKCHHICFTSNTRLQQTGEHAKTFTSFLFKDVYFTTHNFNRTPCIQLYSLSSELNALCKAGK